MAVTVRPARPGDPAAPLLYASAASSYDAFAGSSRRARSLLAFLYPHGGHSASHEVCRVAEDGGIAGVLAALPAEDAGPYARRFVSLAARRLPPHACPRSSATCARRRRSPPRRPRARGTSTLSRSPRPSAAAGSRALLEAAAEDARRSGTSVLALDTGLENDAARAFYERAGFSAHAESRAPDEATAAALGGRGFVSYVRSV